MVNSRKALFGTRVSQFATTDSPCSWQSVRLPRVSLAELLFIRGVVIGGGGGVHMWATKPEEMFACTHPADGLQGHGVPLTWCDVRCLLRSNRATSSEPIVRAERGYNKWGRETQISSVRLPGGLPSQILDAWLNPGICGLCDVTHPWSSRLTRSGYSVPVANLNGVLNKNGGIEENPIFELEQGIGAMGLAKGPKTAKMASKRLKTAQNGQNGHFAGPVAVLDGVLGWQRRGFNAYYAQNGNPSRAGGFARARLSKWSRDS
ncbi:hypothetical protein FB451DRAFT_1184741 [Mycena latifolia]|nr:hypothetical protein FB451DRAFT_1184741 [Mycena latifolia]